MRVKGLKADNRLTVEVAAKQVSEDYQEIRRRLKLSSEILNIGTIKRIEEEENKIGIEDKKYNRYEISHKFLVNHLIASIKKRVAINAEEEKLLRSVLGKLHAMPSREREIAEVGWTKLAQKGKRGQEIFEALKEEIFYFDRILVASSTETDRFFNPLRNNIIFCISGIKSFQDIVGRHKKKQTVLEK